MDPTLDNAGRLRSLLGRLLDLYAGGVAVWVGLWRLCGDRDGWLALANAWAFWWLVTGLPAGMASLARRSRWLAAGWGAGLALLLVRHYGHLLPWPAMPGFLNPARTPGRIQPVQCHRRDIGSLPENPGGRCHPAAGLRLFSSNLLRQERDLGPVIHQVRLHAPDVALFQELIPSFACQLERRLAADYAYRYWFPYPETNMGFGLLSRKPLAVTGLWLQPELDPYALRATLWLPGGPLDVYNVQFVSPTNEVRRWGPTKLLRFREDQVRLVLAEIAKRGFPAVVMGDWNTTEGSDAYRLAAAGLVDAWLGTGRGPGWTWPRTLHPFMPVCSKDRTSVPVCSKDQTSVPVCSKDGQHLPAYSDDRPQLGQGWAQPLLRLDYCFHTPDLAARRMQVVTESIGSDHCPIVVDLDV